jgi:hypothetical protein
LDHKNLSDVGEPDIGPAILLPDCLMKFFQGNGAVSGENQAEFIRTMAQYVL